MLNAKTLKIYNNPLLIKKNINLDLLICTASLFKYTTAQRQEKLHNLSSKRWLTEGEKVALPGSLIWGGSPKSLKFLSICIYI